MEVDDTDQKLLQQFSCMGTTDHEVLATQFRKLVGDVDDSTAAFFLDMNNWNLQAAICSFYEFQDTSKLPSMSFVKDVTVGEGESVPPNTRFIKTWQIANTGDEAWPLGCQLTYTHGCHLSEQERITVPPLPPKQTTDVSVEMTSPSEPGIYECKWRMVTPNGSYFGDTIWVIFTVAVGGTLAVTQQLYQFTELGGSPRSMISSNPFGQRTILSPPPEDSHMG
uniref:EOG090X0CQ9 n=1 Tax=Lynceus sp. MCZ IZ 141354 TaxID=1930659 RepID=A0A9N6ZG66_9CRUS|nr:EOG090X0CQ9 [Lynceus sp. MCZ IZ 141354]